MYIFRHLLTRSTGQRPLLSCRTRCGISSIRQETTANHVRGDKSGYTLVEMAIVLAIMGTVTGGILSLGSAKHEAAKLALTQERLNRIEDALRRFSFAGGYLPCPADPTALPGSAGYGASADCSAAAPAGISATGAGSSEVWIGAIPTRSLNLPDAAMYDAWLSRLTYAVVNDLATDADAFTNYTTCATTGVIRMLDNDGTQITDAQADAVVAYALVSHGKDKKGGRTRAGVTPIVCGATAKDDENCNGDAIFRDSRTVDSTTTANYFDDRVRWKTRNFMQPVSSNAPPPKYLYVIDTGNNRVQKFDGSGVYVSQFGISGSGDGEFASLYGVAIDDSGNVWVADNNNHRMQKFNSSGVYQSQFGSAGSGNGQFGFPPGIAIDGGGNLFVADFGNNRVQKFNSLGVYVSQFGTPGSGDGQFDSPVDIDIDGSGNVWVADFGNHRVQKFNSSGVYQSQFGTPGGGDGQFNGPRDIAIDGSGNLWVVDRNNHRVQKFDSLGVYVSQFGSGPGSGDGQFNIPLGIAIDGSGNLWVADGDNHRVQTFNACGAYQSQFGSLGPGDGQFNTPRGIAIGSQ